KEKGDPYASKEYLSCLDRHELYKYLSGDTYTTMNRTGEEAITIRRHPTDMLHDESTGGTGVHWAGQTDRYLPFDFEVEQRLKKKHGEDSIPADMTVQNWGITYEELEPYYDKFEKTVGVGGRQSSLGG